MSKRLILLVLSLTLVTGCGFKRRGNLEWPSALSGITIEGGDRSFNEQFREQLDEQIHAQSDAQSNEQSDEQGQHPQQSGNSTLVISKSEFQRQVRTIDKNGLASSYDYIYTIDYRVTDRTGVALHPLATIVQHRTLDYQPNLALANEQEKEFLKQEMQQEIIVQLLRRLSRIPEYSGQAQ